MLNSSESGNICEYVNFQDWEKSPVVSINAIAPVNAFDPVNVDYSENSSEIVNSLKSIVP